MAEYPKPGAAQHDQQDWVIFDRFKGINTQSARTGLPNQELAWLENLQPLAENKLQIVPAPLPPATTITLENIVLEFYAAMNGQDWQILFTAAGGGFFYNISTGISGQFAPDGTFSTAPDCTTWQASRILINDSIAGYCTWDGVNLFVQAGGVSPNMQITNGGANYGAPPPVNILVNGSAPLAIIDILNAGNFTTAGGLSTPGTRALSISGGALITGGVQATGTATVTGTSPHLTVSAVTITDPGSGYTTFPTITLTTTGGTPPVFRGRIGPGGATADAIVGPGGVITGIELTNPGSGINPGDVVTVQFGTTTGSGAAIAVRAGTGPGAGMSGSPLASFALASGGQAGSGSFNPGAGPGPGGTWPLDVTAAPSGGTTAVCWFATTSNPAGNFVSSVLISNFGAGYASAPTISAQNAGAGFATIPTFSVVMGNQHVVAPLTISNGGTGYPPSTNIPLVFHGAATTVASGFATTNATGVVTSTTLQGGGAYALGSRPTITVSAGAGAAASVHAWPTVDAGAGFATATIAVFQGRVFLAAGQLLQWSGTGSSVGYNNQGYDDFLLADLSGTLQIVDSDLVHNITVLRSFNNYLWIVGDQSIKQIGSLFPSGAPPFQLLTLSSDQGTIWPKSCISYNRIFMFANPNGIFGVFGSTVQKVSDSLDGIFQNANFAQQPQGAVMDLNSKHNAVWLVRYNDPLFGTRSLLLMFDGKVWWLASQGNTLVAISGAPIFATDLNQLWGSVTGSDVTRLLADPATAQPFRISTALSPGGNPAQGKRILRAGFTANAGANANINFVLEADEAASINRVLRVTPTSLLVGGANDANNNPLTAAGVYLGATLTGTVNNFVLQNVILEYQETALWKGA